MIMDCCLVICALFTVNDKYAQVALTYVTQHRTGHPGYPAVQLRLTSDQISTGSES